jgi:hypothetical protein
VNAFELVTIVVAVVALVLAAISYFRLNRVVDRLGRSGQVWFDHREDMNIESRPNEDERDDPIPRRPLRGRP